MPLNHTIYGFPGIPWVGYLGVGYHGGPMGPWDRWDLGLKDPGPQGPPIIKLDIRHRACAQACQGVFFMLGNVPVPVLVPVPVPGFGFGVFL